MHSKIQLSIIVSLLILIPISLSVGFTVSKYVIYPIIGFLLVYNLLFDRSMIQVLVALFVAIIAQRIYMYQFMAGPIIVEAAVMFVLAAYMYNKSIGSGVLLTNSGTKLFIGAYVVLGLISFLMALAIGVNQESEFAAFQRYFLWNLLFLLYGLQIRQHIRYTQTDIERIFALLAIGVSCLHMFALFTEINLEFVRSDGVAYKFGTYFRYGGVFGNTNVQGSFLVAGMMFGAFLYNRSNKITDRVIGSAAFVCGAVSILMSGSRMGVALVPFIMVLFLFYNRNRLQKLFSFIVGSAIAMMALAATQASKIMTFIGLSQDRIESVSGENVSRQGPWSCSSEVIANNPLGVGIDNGLFMREITPCLGGPLPNPHNLFLDFGAHLGWFGLVLFIVGFVYLIKRMWKFMFGARRMLRDDASTYFALTVILCYGVTEAFAFDLHKMNLVFFFIIGLALGGGSLPKRSRPRAAIDPAINCR